MKEIIETVRLKLREFNIGDAINLFQLNLDPEVIKFTGDLPFKNIEEAEKFIENYQEYKKHGFGRWAVEEKESKQFIGWCGLKLNEENYIDLGFRILKPEWKKGYATEAAKACIEYGFENLKLNLIIARTFEQNYPSQKVLEKIGMAFWKRQYCEGLGQTLYYKIEKQMLK